MSQILKQLGIRTVGAAPQTVDEERVAELEEAAKLADRDGMAVLLAKADPVVPESWRGFTVKAGLGSYPPNVAGSNRKAMYVKLHPIEPLPRQICSSLATDFVLGCVPLSEEGRIIIESNPAGAEAEEAIKLALGAAQAQASKYLPREES